jgi:hypothetical protein
MMRTKHVVGLALISLAATSCIEGRHRGAVPSWAIGTVFRRLSPAGTVVTVDPPVRIRAARSVLDPGTVPLDSLDWTVDVAPTLSIGQADGDPHYLFGAVAGFTRLPNGTIVIGDRKAQNIRFFDPSGRFVKEMGREGQGPGEFLAFNYLTRHIGDSLAVFDAGSRVNVFAPDGRFVRRAVLHFQPPPGVVLWDSPRVRFIIPDGTILTSQFVETCRDAKRQGGVCEVTFQFRRVTDAGAPLADYGQLILSRFEYGVLPHGGLLFVPQWQPQAFVVAHGTNLYYADASSSSIQVFDAVGRRTRSLVVPLPRVAPGSMPGIPVAPNATDVQRQLNQSWNALLQAAHKPRLMAGFDDFFVDRLGNLWLREYMPPWIKPAPSAHRWWILDTLGTVLHQLRTEAIPAARPSLESMQGNPLPRAEIGADYLLVLSWDSLSVDRVDMFRLHKRVP